MQMLFQLTLHLGIRKKVGKGFGNKIVQNIVNQSQIFCMILVQ